MKKLNILLADDHSVVRAGLKTILNLEKDFRVVGDAENGVEAGKLAKELQPDVVVMDLMMPDMSCGEAIRLVLKASPESKVIVLTSYGTSSEIRVALETGAIGAITKNISNRELTDAIRRTAAGERVLSPEIDGALSESEKDIRLTERQMVIVDSITRGFSNADIATQLGISRTRVKQHLSEVFAVLGAVNRAEVAALAMRRNLLKI